MEATAYRDEVSALSEWYYHNNFSLNISKTKEMIVDYRKLQRGGHSPLYINGAGVERDSSVGISKREHRETGLKGQHGGCVQEGDEKTLLFLSVCAARCWRSSTILLLRGLSSFQQFAGEDINNIRKARSALGCPLDGFELVVG
ncbi:hypothetical protein NFI96_030790, partial [Prochilodus magdalenae]